MGKEIQKIGIIGGGQLARMLAQKCTQLGLEAHILCESNADPAAQVTRHFHQGKASDVSSLKSFLEKVDVATFESEFIDVNKVTLASNFSKTPIFPRPEIMGIIQNRKTQKKLLDDAKIDTAPWVFVEHEFQAKEVLASLGQEFILKKCRFGYDGYGTYKVNTSDQLTSIFAQPQEDGYIAEAKINFKRELAFMMVRDQSGQVLSLPLVESFQQDSKCLWVRGPIKHPGFSALERKMKKLLNQVGYVGAMGIELFDYKGKLLVNELAPRVHNSGHYSMDSLTHDQFLLHITAVSGLKIPKKIFQNAKAFAMYNLIGVERKIAVVEKNLFFHWYGKSEIRPGRKMGHINGFGMSPQLALKNIILQMKEVK